MSRRTPARAQKQSGGQSRQTSSSRPSTANTYVPTTDEHRDLRRQVTGIAVAVVGLAALVAVLTPATGAVTTAVSDGLHSLFGIGAFILPVALIAWSVTFFLERSHVMPGRVAIGIAIIVVGVMALVGINTPNADASPSYLFNKYVLMETGGYVGNGIAWVLLTLMGKTVGIIVLIGVIVTGLVVLGLNVRSIFTSLADRHARMRERARLEEQQRRADSAHFKQRDWFARGGYEVPQDYSPTALFDPERPIGRPARQDTRPVTGNLYPDGTFVPLDPQAVTTLLPDSAPQPKPVGRSCGNVPFAGAGGEYVEEPEEASDVVLPPQTEAANDGAQATPVVATEHDARSNRKPSSQWWDPSDEWKRPDFDPDVPRERGDFIIPGVLPDAPDSPLFGADDTDDEKYRLDSLDASAISRLAERGSNLGKPIVSSETASNKSSLSSVSAPAAVNVPSPHDTTAKDAPVTPTEVRDTNAILYTSDELDLDEPAPVSRAPKTTSLPWDVPATATSAAAVPSGETPQSKPFVLPPASLLNKPKHSQRKSPEQQRSAEEMAARLHSALAEFRVDAEVVGWVEGPTFTTFKVNPGAGVQISKFTQIENDIARKLAQPSVRIYAPVPNTCYVGIEVPNAEKQPVYFSEILPSVTGGPLDFAVGLDANGNPVHADLAKLPHILIAGTTGSGKSVMVNTIVMSMLMRDTPDEMRLIMVDPKQVEFMPYNGIPHLIMPVVTDMRQAAAALQWGVTEMDRRYKLFSHVGVRELKKYNEKVDSGELTGPESTPHRLPSIVIVIDELADLMMVAKKDVEASIVRIAQLGRASGIHLIMATQRPSADVVTGLIRTNVANRIGLKVAKGADSQIIIDQRGAEKLLGNGDMLFLQTSFGDKPRRIQGCFLTDREIASVADFLRGQSVIPDDCAMAPLPGAQMTIDFSGDTSDQPASVITGNADEPLAWRAAQLVVETQLGSTSMIQRRLKLGYARAGRIMDMLEEMGVVGPASSSKPREVLIHDLDELETLRGSSAMDGSDLV